MNQVFDLPVEEYVYLSGKPPAKDDNLQPPQDQTVSSGQQKQIAPYHPGQANQGQASGRSGPRLVQSPIFQIPRDDQPIGQHLQQAQQGASRLTTEPQATAPVTPVAAPIAPVGRPLPAPAVAATMPAPMPPPMAQAAPISQPTAPAPPARPTVAEPPARRPNPVFANATPATRPTPPPPMAPAVAASQATPPQPTPIPVTPVAAPPVNINVQLPTNPPANQPPMMAPAQQAAQQPPAYQPPAPIAASPPPQTNQFSQPPSIASPQGGPRPAPPPMASVRQPAPPATMQPMAAQPQAPPQVPAQPMMPPSPPAPAATMTTPQQQPPSPPVARPAGPMPATMTAARPPAPMAPPPPAGPMPATMTAARPPAPMPPPPPAAMTTAPPPAIPPPIQSIATNGRFGGLPPVSSAQPGEVALPEIDNAPSAPPTPGIPNGQSNIRLPGSPIANSDPPPSFQVAGLANKSAANTSYSTSDNSGSRGPSAISQKTRSIGVAIRAAALAKPVMVGGVDSADVALHDPDFGIYSHSEQVRQRHYYSRLTLNMIVVFFIGVAVISAWSFWPKLAGWWSGITTTDQQYFDSILDGLLVTDVQKYDVDLETTIDQFGRADIATVTGEFITTQTDPLIENPSQSSIELDFSHQISVATANTPARYETIILGVDQIINPADQSRYLRIRPIKFNQSLVSLTDLHQTWARLSADETLADDQPSILLDLADDLATNYSHDDYALLLPAINISDPAQRESVKQYLLDNPPYYPSNCRVEDPEASNLITCQILVEATKVQQFYRHVYLEILEAETVPAKYDDPHFAEKLPERFQLTIDITEQRPTKLVAFIDRLVSGSNSTDKLTIHYQNDSNETVEIPNQPLAADSYRQNVRQFETNNTDLFN